jgi:hypothetical protein
MRVNDIADVRIEMKRGHESGVAAMDGGRFESVLNQQMNGISETRSLAAVSEVDDRDMLLASGDRLLALLGNYAADLENPGKMLKQIAPLVNSIENEVSQIQETVSKPSVADNQLRNLMDELTVTANVAIHKFHRGDFI